MNDNIICKCKTNHIYNSIDIYLVCAICSILYSDYVRKLDKFLIKNSIRYER